MKKCLILIAMLAISSGFVTHAHAVAATASVNAEPSFLQKGALYLAEKAVSWQISAADKVKAMEPSPKRDELIAKMDKSLDEADAQFEKLAEQDTNTQFVNRINALRAQIATAKRSLPVISGMNRPVSATAINPILPR